MKYISQLLRSGHTVFTYSFLQDILGISNYNSLKGIVKSLLKANILIAIRPGYRGLPHYQQKELGAKLKSPSYISLETVLQKESVIFQDYSNITTLVWTNTLTNTIANHQYRFRKMKMDILLNPQGIIKTTTFAIATKERAICDMIYYIPNYYFDNIGTLNKELFSSLIPLYPQSTQHRLYTILQQYASN